jgi:Cu/Ag efflux pump CusA
MRSRHGLRPNPQVTFLAEQHPAGSAAIPQYTFSVGQPIELGGKRQRRVDSARAATQVTGYELADLKRQTVYQVKKSFTDILVARDSLALAEENLKALDELERVQRFRAASGDSSELELLRIQVQRFAFERDAIDARQALSAAKIANLVVRVAQDHDPVASLRTLTVSAPNGERIPLSQLAEFVKTDGLAEIWREGNVRRLAIKWSVRERDMGGLVTEAMKKVEAALKLPEGYRMVWSGRFEDQQRALTRLYVIVPLVIVIIFVLLFGAFESVGDALLIMLNLPFALIGGTLALYFWSTNVNISAAVAMSPCSA